MDILRNISKILYKNRTAVLILCIILLGVGLRFYRLSYQSLWTDEIFTYRGASANLSKIILEPDVNLSIQPLYYTIVHFFIRPTENQEALLRLPSVVFGSLSILLIYFIVRNWLGNGGAILSAMIMAVSPFHVWYSQEARPYAMLIFLGLLSIWFLQKLLKDEVNFWWRFGFVISTASVFYCHTVGIAFISFLVFYILLIVPSLKWKAWLPVFISILILILPAFYRMAMVPPIVRGSETWRPFNLFSLPYVLWVFSTGYTIGPTLTELHLPNRMNTLGAFLPLILPVLIIFFTVFMIGAYHVLRRNKFIFWCASLWFLFPLSFALCGAIFTPNEFNVRYTILSFPPFLIFLTIGILSIKFKWIKITALGAFVLVSAFSLSSHYFNHQYYKEDNRGAGQFLTSQAAPNDLVICSTGYTERDLKHYSTRGDITIDRFMTNTLYVKPEKIPHVLLEMIADRGQFWLFLSRTYHSDPEGYISKYCEEHFIRKLEYISSGVELVLYTKISS